MVGPLVEELLLCGFPKEKKDPRCGAQLYPALMYHVAFLPKYGASTIKKIKFPRHVFLKISNSVTKNKSFMVVLYNFFFVIFVDSCYVL